MLLDVLAEVVRDLVVRCSLEPFISAPMSHENRIEDVHPR